MPNFALAHGKPTSSVEVTNVSAHGLWLFAHNGEFFISYDDSPWFREQTISSIINVEEQAPGHYYWPDIDVDLSQEIIEHPERFPLSAQSHIIIGCRQPNITVQRMHYCR